MKYIGIDPGKKTGFAVWDHDEIERVNKVMEVKNNPKMEF